MINRIVLKNWTSHKNTELKFAKGANMLIGVLGSGKSSILDAMCFALFGSFPMLSSRALNLIDVIRYNEKSCSVELDFSLKGENYKITRTIEKKQDKAVSSAKLYKNSRLLDERPSEINNYMEQILEMDLGLFSRTIYAEQNSLYSILDLAPGERRKAVDELIDIYKLEICSKNSTSILNRLSRNLKDYSEQQGKLNMQEAEKKISELKQELLQIENTIKIRRTGLLNIEKNYSTAKTLFESLKEKRIKAEQISKDIEKIKGTIEELKEYNKLDYSEELKLRAGEDLSRLMASLRGKEEMLKKMRLEKESLISKVSSMEKELHDEKKREEQETEIRQKIGSSDLHSLEKEKTASEKALLEISSKISSLENQLKSANSSLSAISSAKESKCPVCLSNLDSNNVSFVKSHWKEEIEKMEKELVMAKARKIEAEKYSFSLNEKTAFLQKLFANLEILAKSRKNSFELIEKTTQMKNDLNAVSQQEGMKSAERDSLLREIKDKEVSLAKITEALEKRNRLQISQDALLKKEKELSSLEFNELLYSKTQKELEDLSLLKGKSEGELNALGAEKSAKSLLLKELESKAELFYSINKKITASRSAFEDISLYKQTIESLQIEVRKKLLDSVNLSLNRIWRVIYPYSDYPEVKIEPSEDSYLFLFRAGNSWIDMNKVASGGEKTIFAIALRISIASVLVENLKFLIFDEPTHNLDEKAVAMLGEAIDSELPGIVEQFFIITHDERLKTVENGKVFYFEREKKGDDFTSVKEI